MKKFDQTTSIVVSNAGLSEACERMSMCKTIALDTEFIRVNTFYPIAALIQVGIPGHCFLVDPLTVTDTSPLERVFADESILKVVHACNEDLEVFRGLFNVLPAPIFDTQVGAALTGFGFSLGYGDLVESIVGVKLDKGETRSNWLQRPLSDAQCHYAALDVIHLLTIHDDLEARLAGLGRESWLSEDCAAVINDARADPDPEDYYLRIGAAWSLESAGLMVLKTLCTWRERQAMKEDVPRNRVVSDSALLAIARDGLHHRDQFAQIAELLPRQIRKYGDDLRLLAEEAKASPIEYHPAQISPPLPRRLNRVVQKLTARVKETAEQLNVAPGILVRRRHLEALLKSVRDDGEPELPDALCGWRRTVIGDELMGMAGQLLSA